MFEKLLAPFQYVSTRITNSSLLFRFLRVHKLPCQPPVEYEQANVSTAKWKRPLLNTTCRSQLFYKILQGRVS
ncbi:hypothetical protein T05_133 [Trichinella murrelli]|uniref:Uncharacterized protein n=1 Tax=Trichinella murrelli TaxID=144512 RepID=A0A0V0U9M7_9BILA|nr:hypothetical protein T05_133 [Trichinella murrelli]